MKHWIRKWIMPNAYPNKVFCATPPYYYRTSTKLICTAVINEPSIFTDNVRVRFFRDLLLPNNLKGNALFIFLCNPRK